MHPKRLNKSWNYRRRWLRLQLYRIGRIVQINEYTFIFLIAAGVGLLSGFLGATARAWFTVSFDWVWETVYPWLGTQGGVLPEWVWAIVIPVTGGLLLGPLTLRFPESTRGHHGIPNVMERIALGRGEIPVSTMVLRTFATTLTLASGGSAGRESPVVQVGAAAGSWVGQTLNLSPERIKLLLACGASGGIAAAFDTPLAGVMFSVELFLGEWTITNMGPLIVSAVLAATIARMSFPFLEFLRVPTYRIESLQEVLAYVLVGLTCGVFAWMFVQLLNAFESWIERSPIPPIFHMAFGGLGAGCIGLFLHEIRGSQFVPISQMLSSQTVLRMAVLLFVAKFLATLFTLGSGCSGGEFAPSLFIGASLGITLGWVIKALWPGMIASPGVYALVGMVAYTGAIMQAPITLVLMAVELSKSYQAVIPMMIAVMTATLTARYLSPDSIYTVVLKKRGIHFYLGRDETVLKEISVEQIMHRETPVVSQNLPFDQIVQVVMGNPGLYFPVVDDDRRIQGIISLDDLKGYLGNKDLAGLVVAKDIANESVITLTPRDTLLDALRKMNMAEMDELPVEEDGRLTGRVTRKDIMKAYQHAVLERQVLEGKRL